MLKLLLGLLLLANGVLLAANMGLISFFRTDAGQREPERLGRQVNAGQLGTTAATPPGAAMGTPGASPDAGLAWPDGLPASATDDGTGNGAMGTGRLSGAGAVGDGASASPPAAGMATPAQSAASAATAAAASALPQAPGLPGAASPAPATPPLAGSAAAAGLAGAVLASAPSGPGAVVGNAASAAPRGGLCLQAGPASADQLTRVLAELRRAGLAEGSWRTQALPVQARYLILMGRYPDNDTLRRKQTELDRRNVDWVTLAVAPDMPAGFVPGLGLGRYDTEAGADAALARLEARRVSTARVVQLPAVEGQVLLRLPGLSPAQRERVVQLPPPVNTRWQPCPAAAAGSAASAPQAGASTRS